MGALTALSILTTVCCASDFYVATNGNDAWSGQLSAPNSQNSNGPFATLERARDAIVL